VNLAVFGWMLACLAGSSEALQEEPVGGEGGI
jgi:hypothetical protein